MAKKVVNQVVIRDEELTPTTLGVYSNKAKNPIGLFILIVAFLVLAIFLPNISTYVDKLTGKNVDNSGPVIVDDGNEDDPIDDSGEPAPVEVEKYKIDASTVVDTEDYSISNIAIRGNKLELSIVNKKSENLDLDNYYFELYSDDLTFLERVKAGEDTLAPSNSKNYSYTINSNPTQFTFVLKTKDDYPVIKLKYNDQQEASITCTKGMEKYTYIFINDVLSKVDYVYTANNVNDSNYAAELMNNQTKANRLNTLNGVTSSVLSSESGYTLNINTILSDVDISQLDDKNFYRFKTSADEVVFKAEARGFNCN